MKGKRPGGWVALAWRHRRDPKFTGVSDLARLLWIDGLCYAGEQETDGKLPGNLREISGNRDGRTLRKLAGELLGAGLWITTDDGGFAIPFESWNRWQDTADQRREARGRNSQRQAQWRLNQANGNALRNGPSGAGAGVGRSPLPPDPPHPVETQSNRNLWAVDDRDGFLYASPSEDP